jgi:hypothetical protein
MRTLLGISIAACIAGTIMAGAVLPAGAADQRTTVKAPVAVPVVVCSNLNWSHGWLDHGGWGGWGYHAGLIVDGWPGNCSSLVGVGPYAYAPREPAPDRPKR